MKIPNYRTSIPSAVLAALALTVTTSSQAQIAWSGPATGGTWNTTNTNWATATATPWEAAGNFAALGNASVTLGTDVRMNGFSGTGSIGAGSAQYLRLGGAGVTSTFSGTIGNNVGVVWDNNSILNLTGSNSSTNQWVFKNGGTFRIGSATAWQTTNSAKVEASAGTFTFELAAANLQINTTNLFLNNSGTAATRFAAVGVANANRTVTWTGVSTATNASAAIMSWNGSANSNIGETLGLGNTTSTGTLVWASGINLNGGDASVTRKLAAINGSGGAIGGEIAGVISDTGMVKATFEKTGTGTLVLSAANTFAGPTTISAGTLATGTTGTLGAGNVTISAAVGKLTLGNANSIADTATLSLFAGSSLFLNFDGTEQIGGLTVAGTALGINDVASSANFNTNKFSAADLIAKGYANASGKGLLQVGVSAIPEPSTFAALAGLGVLGFAACRRRRTV
jgi:autotransporter-associated beta strand protein